VSVAAGKAGNMAQSGCTYASTGTVNKTRSISVPDVIDGRAVDESLVGSARNTLMVIFPTKSLGKKKLVIMITAGRQASPPF
jgi:hypothetical protein